MIGAPAAYRPRQGRFESRENGEELMNEGVKLVLAAMSALCLVACGESGSDVSPSEDASTDVMVQSDTPSGEGDTQSSPQETSEADSETMSPGPDSEVSPEDAATGEADAGEGEEDDAMAPDGLSEESVDAGESVDVGESAGNTDALTEDAGPEQDTSLPSDAADGAPSEEDAMGPSEDAQAAECMLPCDCAQQGADCIEGQCILGIMPVFCCELDGCVSGEACVKDDGSEGLCGLETSAAFGILIINEVLTDGSVDGDPNGDGDSPDPMGDEFVELVNVGGEPLDLSAFQLFETNMPFVARHTFDAGTLLAPGAAIVVFGGGTAPDDTPEAQFVVSNAGDPGIPLGLALNNEGDTLSVLDADGLHVASFSYGGTGALEAITDQSMTRQPDLSGDFVAHSEAAGSPDALFSPGTRVDGSPF